MLTARMAQWTPVLHIHSRHTMVCNNSYLKGLSYKCLTLATVNNHELLSPTKGHVYEMHLRKYTKFKTNMVSLSHIFTESTQLFPCALQKMTMLCRWDRGVQHHMQTNNRLVLHVTVNMMWIFIHCTWEAITAFLFTW